MVKTAKKKKSAQVVVYATHEVEQDEMCNFLPLPPRGDAVRAPWYCLNPAS
jgi:hypothetical protein